MASQPTIQIKSNDQATDSEPAWGLNPEQMLFMMRHNNAIEAAYDEDDMAYFEHLVLTEEYKQAFADMSFDEAYDRYECMLEDSSGDS